MCRNYDGGECIEDDCQKRITCHDFNDDRCTDHSINGNGLIFEDSDDEVMVSAQSNHVISEPNNDGLWPKFRKEQRDLHGVAFPDPTDPQTLRINYVNSEIAARLFAAENGGVYVTANQTTTTERTDWKQI